MSSTLTFVKDIVAKNKQVITDMNIQKYLVGTYTQELELERGKFGFNIRPLRVDTRLITNTAHLPDILIEVLMYYALEEEELYDEAYAKLLDEANLVLTALNNKQNLVVGIATVVINMEFDNPQIDNNNRLIDVAFICDYKKFAMG